jgi:CRISPR-associated protein Cmr4
VDVTEFLLYLYAESPVHAGAADSLDLLDLPVQREAATGYPVIWGQSLKGALRQAAADRQAAGDADGWTSAMVIQVFGSEPGEPGQTSEPGEPDESRQTTPGLLAVGDAQLIAMPVPTLRRTFAWVTSDIALGRLARKYTTLGRAAPRVPSVAEDRGAAPDAQWTDTPNEVLGPCLVPLGTERDESLREWAGLIADDAIGVGEPFQPFAGKFRTDLLLAGSQIMPTLLRECTEQSVRVQLNKDKIVENGPFYSEYLPAETILAASLTLRQSLTPQQSPDAKAEDHQTRMQAVRDLLDGRLLQVGGDETLGKGLVWGRLLERGPAQ